MLKLYTYIHTRRDALPKATLVSLKSERWPSHTLRPSYCRITPCRPLTVSCPINVKPPVDTNQQSCRWLLPQFTAAVSWTTPLLFAKCNTTYSRCPNVAISAFFMHSVNTLAGKYLGLTVGKALCARVSMALPTAWNIIKVAPCKDILKQLNAILHGGINTVFHTRSSALQSSSTGGDVRIPLPNIQTVDTRITHNKQDVDREEIKVIRNTGKLKRKVADFWNVTPCTFLCTLRRFDGPCCLELQDKTVNQAVSGATALVHSQYLTTRRHNPRNQSLIIHCHEHFMQEQPYC